MEVGWAGVLGRYYEALGDMRDMMELAGDRARPTRAAKLLVALKP